MWMCHYCGEGGMPDSHKCNKRVLQAVEYGKGLGREQQKRIEIEEAKP